MTEMEERVARAICYANCLAAHPGDIERATCQADNGWDMWLAEARAAIAATPEWQTIETAPKDGTPILAFDGREMMVVANDWNASRSVWTGWLCVAYDCTGMAPTHWMPLPAPPSAAADPGIPVYRLRDGTEDVLSQP